MTLFCGRGCAGAHGPLLALAEALKAPIVHALGGKEHVEYDNPYDVGMTGLIGFSSGYEAMQACDTLLMLGTDFPTSSSTRPRRRSRRWTSGRAIWGGGASWSWGWSGTSARPSRRCCRGWRSRRTASTSTRAWRYAKSREGLDELAQGTPGRLPIHPQYLTRILSEQASEDAVFTFDVGTPTIWAARYLKMNGRRRMVGSLVHGSMANALPQAIGVQAADRGRQVISLSGTAASPC